jgi:phosphoglycolate phosphatase
MSNRYELIVFDWDGTLIDSASAIATSIQLAASDLGLPVPSVEDARHVIGLGLRDALTRAIPDVAPSDYDHLAARFRHHFIARDHEMPLFDGVRELLIELKGRGFQLAIATGKSSQGLARALQAAALDTLFTATRSADQTVPKPDPAMLNELLAEFRVGQGSALMIGDTAHDLTMASAAGVAAIGVTYGAHSPDALRRCRSLALLDSVDGLAQWLATNG